jgi:hypothetical protein
MNVYGSEASSSPTPARATPGSAARDEHGVSQDDPLDCESATSLEGIERSRRERGIAKLSAAVRQGIDEYLAWRSGP